MFLFRDDVLRKGCFFHENKRLRRQKIPFIISVLYMKTEQVADNYRNEHNSTPLLSRLYLSNVFVLYIIFLVFMFTRISACTRAYGGQTLTTRGGFAQR